MSVPETLREGRMGPAAPLSPGAKPQDPSPMREAEAAPAGGALPPLPDARAVSELLPEGMGLDVLRSGRIVPLRVEDGVMIVGAV